MQVTAEHYTAEPGFLAAHPRINWWVQRASSAYHYAVSFQWVVDLVRWMITTGGNIAESAFLLATVYVTINVVAHRLVAWLLPNNIILSLNQISVIAFSVLPELIVAAAIAATFDHYKFAFATKKWYSFLWAGLYTIPTLIFVGMTIATITSFVSLEALNVDSYQATGAMLVIRCLAGWSYGMLQTLFAKLGKSGYAAILDRLKKQVAEKDGTLKECNVTITDLRQYVQQLEEKVTAHQEEITALNIKLASRKVTRRSGESDTGELQSVTAQSKSDTGELQSVTAQSKSDTDKKRQLKEHFSLAMLQGQKPNYRKIASASGIGYNTVRKYADDIIEEVTNEHQAIPKMALVK